MLNSNARIDSVPVGRLDATVRAFSPDGAVHGIENWSMREMQTQEDAFKHRPLANGLRVALQGVKTAYAPNVAASSAKIATAKDLRKNRIRLGEVVLYRNKGLPADGVLIKKNEAFVMSGGGCPIIIATDGTHMIVAHAGRDSLIERDAVLGRPVRRHVSVVYAIIEALLEKGESLDRITACMLYSIPAEVFEHRLDHPEHGSYNRALGNFIDARWPECTTREDNAVYLNLESVFLAQAIEVGVRDVWATRSLRDFPALAHTRDGKDPSRRNLFVIKRNA